MLHSVRSNLALKPKILMTIAITVLMSGITASPAWALIGSNSVGSAQIINGSIKAVDIANAAITAAKVANGAIRTQHLADGAVTSAKIGDGTILNRDIAAGAAIAAAKINRAGLNADLVDGLHASAFAGAGHDHNAAYAGIAHGHDTSYSALGHDHDTEYVNDDTNEIDDADIADGAISAVKIAGTAWTGANDGSGSGLDADTIDGSTAADFAGSGHLHDDRYFTETETSAAFINDNANEVGNADIIDSAVTSIKIADNTIGAVDIADGAISAAKLATGAVTSAAIANGSIVDADIAATAGISASKINTAGLNADTLDGQHATAFAGITHSHNASEVVSGTLSAARLPADGYNGTYFTESEADTRFMNSVGDSMSGTLTAGGLVYGSAKTGRLVIPAAAFRPVFSSTAYSGFLAYIYDVSAGYHEFVAPVYLPNGATVTAVEWDVYDNDVAIDGEAGLGKVDNPVGVTWVGYMVTSGAVGAWQTVTPPFLNGPTIDTQYDYIAILRLNGNAGANLKSHNIKVTYTYTSPGN